MVVVTFFSDGEDEGYGFQLSYDVRQTQIVANPAVARLVSSAAMYPEVTPTQYPSEGSEYKDYALAAFVYSPDFRLNPEQQKLAQVKDISFEPACGCCDFIYVLDFWPHKQSWNSYSGWEM